jgi:hypothetical protein
LTAKRTISYLPRIGGIWVEHWEQEGRVYIATRGLKEAMSILAGNNPAVFGEEMDRKILARFERLLGLSGQGVADSTTEEP